MTGERRRTLFLLAAHTLWLWFLLPPALAVARGQVRSVPVAAIGLAVFTVLAFASAAVTVTDPGPRVGPVTYRAGLGLLAALGTGLAAFAGDPRDWLILLLFVASAGAAGLPGTIPAFLWVGAGSAMVVLIGALHRLPAGDVTSTAVITLLAGSVTVAFARIARLVGELRRTQHELARTTVERERLRFARDLHDLLGHTLSLVVVKAQVVRRLAPSDPERAAAEAADIERIGRTALAEVREAVTGYRERDFATELENTRTLLTDIGIEVTVRNDGGADVDEVFRWVLREALTNVLRHSRATRCDIALGPDGTDMVLTVRDDGLGGTPAPGNGLRGLTERLERAGGTLHAGPAPGGGLLLTARLPDPPGRVSR
ncbi:sensor histidine kinase [Actinoplanes sp. G11-F43]|uniref:sensor histidine kinase n=1 Tax=Actinoplanes sp. G11-F43 TaxID=3424130 RepID=UPI003D34C0E4